MNKAQLMLEKDKKCIQKKQSEAENSNGTQIIFITHINKLFIVISVQYKNSILYALS